MSLIGAFLAQAEARPDAAAIITPRGEIITFADLSRRSAARARTWEGAGIGPGDIVLVARGVSPALYETLLAIFRLGAVAMFPEPAAGLPGLIAAINAAKPKAMAAGWLGRSLRIVTPELARLRLLSEVLASGAGDGPFAYVAGDDPALVTFTSGSTGRPKGIVRSAEFLMLQHRLLENLRRTTPDDVDLISLPVFILSNLAAGAASVIPDGRLTRPALLDGARLRTQIAAHRVNRVVAPPAVCVRLVDGASPMTNLAAMFTGGGPVFPNLLHDMQRAAPNAAIHAVYGSTEAEPIAHVELREIADAEWAAMAQGAGLLAGRPVPEARVAIDDTEINVSGPHVNRGYLDPSDNASTKAIRDGVLWHRTGDAGRMDESGRLWLLGRKEASADGLYPFAIETAAMSWPGVERAALLAGGGHAKLALSGRTLNVGDLHVRLRSLGDIELVVMKSVPMDKRHNSKADYARLRKQLA